MEKKAKHEAAEPIKETRASSLGSADFVGALAACRKTRVLGRFHRHFEQSDSTNDDAAAWAQEGAPHGALVTADRQLRGRGRLGRSWDSPGQGDIYASLIIRPDCILTQGPASLGPGGRGESGEVVSGVGDMMDKKTRRDVSGGDGVNKEPVLQIAAMGLAVALGILDGILAAIAEQRRTMGEEAGGEDWALKWPNDILVKGQKLAGILCEARWQGPQVSVVCGFGINLGRLAFEGELRERATSLALWAKTHKFEVPSRAQLLAAVLSGLERRLCDYVGGGFAAIRADYQRHCRELGGRIRLSGPGPDGAPAGTFYQVRGLDRDGALLVQRSPSSEILRVQSADVWLVDPADSPSGGPAAD